MRQADLHQRFTHEEEEELTDISENEKKEYKDEEMVWMRWSGGEKRRKGNG